MLRYAMLHYTTLYYTMLYCTILHLHYISLHYIRLDCIVLYYTSVNPSHNATLQVATQLRGLAAQWKRMAVETPGSGSAGQFCCRNVAKVATECSVAAEMRGQW